MSDRLYQDGYILAPEFHCLKGTICLTFAHLGPSQTAVR